jgi:hypothetical protein
LMKDLSVKFSCDFVNQNQLIDKNKKNFVDSMHLSPDGMKKLSENFGKVILKSVK